MLFLEDLYEFFKFNIYFLGFKVCLVLAIRRHLKIRLCNR